jgi:large subunit ribosomal protein L25
MELTVECQKRAPGSKSNALRRQGMTPAVLYGHKGLESMSLVLPTKAAELLVKKASLNNTLVQVNVAAADGAAWTGQALLREVQSHPWRGWLYHLSFFAIAGHGNLETRVRLHFVGEAIGVKRDGGSLDTVLTELQVQSPPESIPESIEIDVSQMEVGDALHVHELPLPAGVIAMGEPDRVVVSILGGRPVAGEGEAEA